MRPNSGATTTDLVAAARDGDREAFGRLHDLYAAMVHGILLARVPAQEADDLVQEVFLHALRKLSGLRSAEAFGPWVAAIARTFTVRFHRRRRWTGRLPDELPDDPTPNPTPNQTSDEATAALAAIRRLPEAYRETLMLRLVEGLTGPQIAVCTGLTQGSVRVNLHRGFSLLREQMNLPEDPS